MACTKPKPAWLATLPNSSGKHSISFDHKKRPADYWIGCGKCDGCTARKRMDWAVRMAHEAQFHKRNCFVTLTYENAPDTINRADPQKFLKRLRHHSKTPIRYFLTGEYGDKTHRPHYHAILFGEDFLGGSYNINNQLYGNHILSKIWKHGDVAISEFTMGTALYTAGYTAKKLNDKDTFSIMSRQPPLGAEWVRQNYPSLYHLEKVVIDGSEFPIPEAYMRWLDGDEITRKIKENRELPERLTDRQLDSKEIHYHQHKLKRSQNERH